MTKGMTATCAHILADRGLLDYDAPVAQYWPEFAAHGKESIPVRWLLSHQAGLVAVDLPLKPRDHERWDIMIHALEETTPQWEPGTKNGYHMITFGWLVGEVVGRISGAASLGTFFREEITGPLGADFFIGTPESEDHRTASIIQPAPNEIFVRAPDPDAPTNALMERSLLHDSELVAAPNGRGWRGAELPGGTGHANARAAARVYSALAQGGELDGVRLISPERVDVAREIQFDSPDEVLTMRTRRSLGYTHPVLDTGNRRGPQAFGHAGAGGSLGFADPEHRIGFGYAMNQMRAGDFGTLDPRAQLLAVYESRSASRAPNDEPATLHRLEAVDPRGRVVEHRRPF